MEAAGTRKIREKSPRKVLTKRLSFGNIDIAIGYALAKANGVLYLTKETHRRDTITLDI